MNRNKRLNNIFFLFFIVDIWRASIGWNPKTVLRDFLSCGGARKIKWCGTLRGRGAILSVFITITDFHKKKLEEIQTLRKIAVIIKNKKSPMNLKNIKILISFCNTMRLKISGTVRWVFFDESCASLLQMMHFHLEILDLADAFCKALPCYITCCSTAASKMLINMSHLMTKPAQWPLHPAKSQISLSIHPVWSEFCCPNEETLGPQLQVERTAKTLIRLGSCLGWSESSLDTHIILLVLSWGRSTVVLDSFIFCSQSNTGHL